MKELRKVIINTGSRNTLLDEFLPLYLAFKDIPFGEKVNIDVSNLEWINPLTVLFLSSYIDFTGSVYKAQGDVASYLKTIKFPGGISPSANNLNNKNYIPIYTFKKDFSPVNHFLNVIKNNIDSAKYAEDPLFYTVSELFDNVSQHSKSEKGFIVSQYYPQKEYLENCIIDTGIGLRQAYLENGIECLSDEKAIELALSGKSTKNSDERGYGLRKTVEIICDGLKGEVLLISGSSLVFLKSGKREMVILDGFSWKGLIVAFRIPKTTKKIDLVKYYE